MNRVVFDIEVSGCKLAVHANVREAGDDLLFLIHGLGCSARSFRDIWVAPGFEGTSIVAIDLPGFGRSEAPGSFSFSMEDQALICERLLERFPSKRVHLVGHSMGGAVGLLLPEQALQSLASFINVEGNLNPEDCVFGSRRTAAASFDEFINVVLPDFKAGSATWCSNGLNVASPRAFHESAKSLVAWSDNGKLLEAFQKLVRPKVYMYGEENAAHPTVESVGGIGQVQISRAGHFVMNDNATEFYSEILAFITKNRSVA